MCECVWGLLRPFYGISVCDDLALRGMLFLYARSLHSLPGLSFQLVTHCMDSNRIALYVELSFFKEGSAISMFREDRKNAHFCLLTIQYDLRPTFFDLI